MSTANWKPGELCAVYFPHDGRHNTLRPGVIIGAGYTPDQRRVQYEDGSTFIVHVNFLYALGEQPTAQRRAPVEYTAQRGRKSGEAKAPRKQKAKRGVTGKRRQQVRDILRLAMEQRLAQSVTPPKWED